MTLLELYYKTQCATSSCETLKDKNTEGINGYFLLPYLCFFNYYNANEKK